MNDSHNARKEIKKQNVEKFRNEIRQKSPAQQLRITIERDDPSDVLMIRSYSDFVFAIEDSVSGSPQFMTYSLQTDLFFNSDSPSYLNEGTNIDDYMRLFDGQVFDGNGFTITLESGCEPPINFYEYSDTLPSIIPLLYSGDESTPSIIQNVAVRVAPGVRLLSVFADVEATNAEMYNISILFESLTITDDDATHVLYGYCNDDGSIRCDTINIRITNPIASPVFFSVFGYSGADSFVYIKNVYVVAPSISENCFIFYGSQDDNILYSVSNAYVHLYDQSEMPEGSCAIFFGNDNTDVLILLQDIYIIFNSYDETTSITSPSFFLYNIDNTAVIEYVNFYTNNDTVAIYDDQGITRGTPLTSFTWQRPPVFSDPDGFDASTPNRLKAFLKYPFNASTYPLADTLSMMIQSTTLLPDAVVGTQSGKQFLFRMVNPIDNAPQPLVITNEYIQRRDLAPNYIPSRNGFVR